MPFHPRPVVIMAVKEKQTKPTSMLTDDPAIPLLVNHPTFINLNPTPQINIAAPPRFTLQIRLTKDMAKFFHFPVNEIQGLWGKCQVRILQHWQLLLLLLLIQLCKLTVITQTNNQNTGQTGEQQQKKRSWDTAQLTVEVMRTAMRGGWLAVKFTLNVKPL